MIFRIPVYPTRENTGLKTQSEASYNAIKVGGGGVKRSSNFSTLHHILIGNGTYIAAKHAILISLT